MSRKRNYLTIVLVCALCGIGLIGCGLTSQERIQAMQTVVEQAQAQSALLTEDLQTLKTAMEEMRQQLERPDLTPEDKAKIEALIAETLEQTEIVIAKKEEIDAGIEAWKTKIDEAVEHGTNVGDEITLWGEGLKEASPIVPPPIGVWIGIIGTLFGAIGTGISRRYKQALATEKTNTESVVNSVNKLMESSVITNNKEAKTILMSHQTGDAINRVREIKAEKT